MRTEPELQSQIANQARARGWTELLTDQSIHTDGLTFQPDIVLCYNLYPLATAEIRLGAHGPLRHWLDRSLENATHLNLPFALATNEVETIQQSTKTSDITALETIPTPKELWTNSGLNWSTDDPRLAAPLPLGNSTARIHQCLAIRNVLDSVAAGSTRIGLAMAAGTGRSFVAMQLLWKLIGSGHRRRALFLFESSAVLEQTLDRLSSAQDIPVSAIRHPSDFLNPARIHLCTMHRFLKQWEESPEAFRSDWYDLLLTQDARQTEHHTPRLNHFHQAIQIAISSAVSSQFPAAFQYSLEDALAAEQTEPPAGFRSVRLGDVADLRIGFYTTQARPVSAPQIDFALITARDISEGEVNLTHAKQITAQLPDRLALKKGDILISSLFSASRPRIAIARDTPQITAAHSHSIIRVRVDPRNAKPEDVYAFLTSDTGLSALRQYSSGLGGMLRLTVSALSGLRVFLPEATTEPAKPLSAAARALSLITDKVLPALARADQAGLSDTAENPDLEIAAGVLKQILPDLSPPSLSERVVTEYPTPIAVAFRRFQEARFNPHEQLLRLKDLYESAIVFAYHSALSDWLHNLDRTQFAIDDRGARRAYNGFSMSARIDFLDYLLQTARVKSNLRTELFIPELADVDLITPARELQDFRNTISHTSTAAESRQRKIIQHFQPTVERLLSSLGFLTQYRLVRIPLFYFKKGQMIQRLETYQGVTPSIEEHPSAKDAPPLQADHDHLVLLSPDYDVLDLHPFYQLVASEETRNEQHICFLKQRKSEAKVLQGESITGAFELHLNDFEHLERLLDKQG